MSDSTSDPSSGSVTPGFSPKPATVESAYMAASPSVDPETPSPNTLLQAPPVPKATKTETSGSGTATNGIVSFDS